MPQTKAVLKGKRCECTSCGEIFSSISSFDKHRPAPKDGTKRVCIDPLDCGLEIRERGGNTYWTSPNPFFPPAG